MKTLSKFCLSAALWAASVAGAFAAPDRILELGETVVPTAWTAQVSVPVTKEVQEYFAQYHIRGQLDPSQGAVAAATADDIEELLTSQERKDELIDLIKPLLQAQLEVGKTESASMQVGRHLWHLSVRASS